MFFLVAKERTQSAKLRQLLFPLKNFEMISLILRTEALPSRCPPLPSTTILCLPRVDKAWWRHRFLTHEHKWLSSTWRDDYKENEYCHMKGVTLEVLGRDFPEGAV